MDAVNFRSRLSKRHKNRHFPTTLSESLTHTIEALTTWCAAYPGALFLAIAILPGLGFPTSPLLVLAGVAWGSTWQTCSIAMAAVALNMSWTHFLAASPARSTLTRVLGKRWRRWENIHPQNLRRFTVLMRITPGIPFFVQNYMLGLIGVPFLTYLLISIPLNGMFVVGFVLTGGAIFEGDLGLIIAGVAILLAAGIGFKLLRAKLAGHG